MHFNIESKKQNKIQHQRFINSTIITQFNRSIEKLADFVHLEGRFLAEKAPLFFNYSSDNKNNEIIVGDAIRHVTNGVERVINLSTDKNNYLYKIESILKTESYNMLSALQLDDRGRTVISSLSEKLDELVIHDNQHLNAEILLRELEDVSLFLEHIKKTQTIKQLDDLFTDDATRKKLSQKVSAIVLNPNYLPLIIDYIPEQEQSEFAEIINSYASVNKKMDEPMSNHFNNVCRIMIDSLMQDKARLYAKIFCFSQQQFMQGYKKQQEFITYLVTIKHYLLDAKKKVTFEQFAKSYQSSKLLD